MRSIRCVLLSSLLLAALPVPVVSQAKEPTPKRADRQPAPPRPEVRLSEALAPTTAVHAPLRAEILKAQSRRDLRAPEGWQPQRRWSPRRHFGPLFGSSPDLHLNGGFASFVYNSYFQGNADADVFKKYFGPNLPSNPASAAAAIPGSLPVSGFGDVRLGLDRLTYSSRYGGAFLLTFRTLEDLQVEFRAANVAWDISVLEVLIYVRPVPAYFNPNAPIWSVPDGNVHVEFRPRGVVAYAVSASGDLAVQDGDPLPALRTALANAAQTMVAGSAASAFRLDATRFSHGLVHAAFWQEIGQNRNVTAAEVSDGHFLPRTAQGFPVAVVNVQLANVRLDTELGGEEISITLDAQHAFQGLTPANSPTFSWVLPAIDDRGSTAWQTVGVFPLDWDCGQLQSVLLMLTLTERDLMLDDVFHTDPAAFQTGPLDCGGMQTAFNGGQFGLYRELPEQQLLITRSGSNGVAGSLAARIRIYLIKQ